MIVKTTGLTKRYGTHTALDGVDLARSPVRYLPKWAWALICFFSVPIGGIVYLLVGKEHK